MYHVGAKCFKCVITVTLQSSVTIETRLRLFITPSNISLNVIPKITVEIMLMLLLLLMMMIMTVTMK